MRYKKRYRWRRFAPGPVLIFLTLFTLTLIACTPSATPQATPPPSPSSSPSPTEPTTPKPTHTATASPSPTRPPTRPPSPTLTPSPTEIASLMTEHRDVKRLFPPATLESGALAFATFAEAAVDAAPAVQHPPIAPDLSNVANPFLLSPTQIERLGRDGFVVSPGTEKEFFVLYEKARYAQVPILVTSDSLLHIYHLLFDKILRTAEVTHLIPLLHDLNRGLLARADSIYRELEGSPWQEAARRTVAFVAVGSKLLDAEVQIPEYAAGLAEAELALIEAAKRIDQSPLFPGLDQGEDYTQYIPRGHYTLSDELAAYFKSMMWYGRMTFRLTTSNPEVGRAETRTALLLVHALRTTEIAGRPALALWADLYNPTAFFVGRSDDLTVVQYGAVMDEIYGTSARARDIADDALLEAFITEAGELPPPRILGMVIVVGDDVTSTTKGMRLMGQRFVPDAYIFRQLIYENVGEPGNPRSLPVGLDVPAAMGSARAYEILEALGETGYARYPEQMAKMQAWTGGLDEAAWTETLYTTWLYSFYPLLAVPGEGYPQFMRSPAWVDKQLNTVLGSWAELKHDTILYAKQAYSELGGAPEPPPPALPPRGYVEPVPAFYARLAALTAMTRDGLRQRGMLTDADDHQLQQLAYLVETCRAIAEKELRGEPLSEEDYDTIRFYGGHLERLTAAASQPLDSDWPGSRMDEEPQAAVIADVATAPSLELVLEVGVGRIHEIYAVVPLIEDDGTTTLQVVQGGVFAYHEFPWPMGDRLTDEAWRAMLEAGTAPAPPAWTASFLTSESGYAMLQAALHRFHESLVDAYWLVDAARLGGGEGLRAQLAPELAALEAEGRCQRRLLLNLTPRSVDRQSEALAVVTARETWEDAQYRREEDWCYGYSEEALARRGPYTLDVTYTLEWIEGRWQVTRAIYASQPPAWE